MAETALATTYPALGGALAAVSDNLDGEKIGMLDLPRLRVPAGGGMAWEVDGEPVKAVEGIMLSRSRTRVYWDTAYDQRSDDDSEPTCKSEDGITGVGDPGGECATCPMAQFGSKGDAQACTDQRNVLFLLAGDVLPHLLVVPPSSLRPLRDYMLTLTRKGRPYHAVVTRMSLAKEKNKGGIEYSRIMFEHVSDIDGGAVQEYRESMVP